MLRDGWNFHGDIATELETMARKLYGDKERPFGKLYDADGIECEYFAECMIEMVRKVTSYTSEDDSISSFVKKCIPYMGMSGKKIDRNISQELFDEFCTIVEDKIK